ncbi:MAG: hypothetical protein H6Q67_1271 [Firmicutes bacterium]|nr:hypothetical protein [Bacillota bacterium]
MFFESIPILLILVLATLGNNQSVAVAAAFLLVIKLLGFENWFPILEAKGLQLGITILTIAILTPLVSGRITLTNIKESLCSPFGLIALILGIFVAWTAGRGMNFLNTSPEMASFLVLGTIVGVCFLKGVAVGPLIAGGLVSLSVSIYKLFT